uniref:Zinc metalloproteinase n=1 Tax=Strongyloides venezuelensis TaxID=75913 RepID=A0A0K0F132_STRVS
MLKTFFIFLFIIFFSQIYPVCDVNVTKNTISSIEKILKRVFDFKSSIKNSLSFLKNNMSQINSKKSDSEKAMEQSGFYQGDMLLTEDQSEDLIDKIAQTAEESGVDVSDIVGDKETRKKRRINRNKNTRWNFPIHYYVDYSVDKDLIRKALKILEDETCLQFQQVNKPSESSPGLRYYKGDGCNSHVGMKPTFGFQDISIGDKCNGIGTVQHETMHALGFIHEQSRADRDRYLNVFLENVIDLMAHNFIKLELKDTLSYGSDYDFGSVMQYSTNAFSKNKQATMLPINKLYEMTPGLLRSISFLDARTINQHYCYDKIRKDLYCENEGYADPNKINQCRCIKGFTGRTCNKIETGSNCGKQELVTYGEKGKLQISGKKDCVYHIKFDGNSESTIKIEQMSIYPHYDNRCEYDNSVEVKFKFEKATSGAHFCHKKKGMVFDVEDSYALIHYRSTDDDNYVTITYE